MKDAVSSAERDAMIAPLVAHNAAQGVDFTNTPFALALEDAVDLGWRSGAAQRK
jgi:hypothetical protein